VTTSAAPLTVPPFTDFFNPALDALRFLGNSAALSELEEKTAELTHLPELVLAQPHIRHKGTARQKITSVTEFAYRLRWALTYLKKAGLITNSERGVWAFTEAGKTQDNVDPRAIVEKARAAMGSSESGLTTEIEQDEAPAPEIQNWEDELLEILVSLPPEAFERLTQRLLREAGFAEVKVTGRSGDGGIDGRGILRLNDLINMSAVFQCKRYRDNVGASEIRDFRGAFTGRADRGVFVTTSAFTPAAVQEATRDGVTPIDLIDGERLIGLMKRFSLGLNVEMVESVSIDRKWFQSI